MPSFRKKLRSLFGKKTDAQKPLAQNNGDSPQPSAATNGNVPPTVAVTNGDAVQVPAASNTIKQAYWAPAQRNAQQQPVAQDKSTAAGPKSATTGSTLQVQLKNDSSSSTVYAYITGQAIDNNNALFLLQSDAQTAYYPANPSSDGTALSQNVSIALGAPGNTITATIPKLAGARIWFSIGAPLVFKVNPGPGLVEPSVFNNSDPNINTNFGFAEFTYNDAEVFANISYVDFVGPPISLSLTDTTGTTQHISGLPANGLNTICSALQAQTAKDGQPWSSLIVKNSSGQNLRVLSPNSGLLLNSSWFSSYWTAYVNQVFAQYNTTPLTVDTQASYGNVNGQTNGTASLNYGAGGSFGMPSAGDIFGCSSGPFATGSNAETNAIIPRLAAAFNRSTLLLSNNTPDGTGPTQYYTNAVTNHYARILHATNLDGKGYAFPYDDVTPDGGVPQEGAVVSGSPTLMSLAVGGNSAYAS